MFSEQDQKRSANLAYQSAQWCRQSDDIVAGLLDLQKTEVVSDLMNVLKAFQECGCGVMALKIPLIKAAGSDVIHSILLSQTGFVYCVREANDKSWAWVELNRIHLWGGSNEISAILRDVSKHISCLVSCSVEELHKKMTRVSRYSDNIYADITMRGRVYPETGLGPVKQVECSSTQKPYCCCLGGSSPVND